MITANAAAAAAVAAATIATPPGTIMLLLRSHNLGYAVLITGRLRLAVSHHVAERRILMLFFVLRFVAFFE
eukprot:scaffold9421_cov47-Attheya_sp.AAC.3